MAGHPPDLSETPAGASDLLSDLLRRIHISESLQYCFMPSGDWEIDATPATWRPRAAMGFHIVAEGACTLGFGNEVHDIAAGDIALFPFSTPHGLWTKKGAPEIDPGGDLPAKPWREVPRLVYGDGSNPTRLLCGYLICDPMQFPPFRETLPKFIHIRGAADPWLKAMITQIVAEVDRPKDGGFSMLERLTELTFVEILRRAILSAPSDQRGWTAALGDPVLARALALIHGDPGADWTVAGMARSAGTSRSVLAERFETVLGTAPMRYLRDWRLYLASVALREGHLPITTIATNAGYQTVAAFSRAFSRAYGKPPAKWRASSGSG